MIRINWFNLFAIAVVAVLLVAATFQGTYTGCTMVVFLLILALILRGR